MQNLVLSKFGDWLMRFFFAKGVVYAPVQDYIWGTMHLIVLAIVFASTIGCYFVFKPVSHDGRYRALKVVAWTLAVCEIVTRISKLVYFADLGQLDFVMAVKIIVPLQFCQLMVWVIIVAILTNNRSVLSFGCLCGLLGATFFLAYPIEGLSASFFNIRAFNSVFTHSLAFVAAVNLFALGEVKLEMKDLGKTFLLLLGIVAYGGLANLIFKGENYMFMIENPTKLTFGKIPYQVIFALLVAGFIVFCYFGFWLVDKIRARHAGKKQTATTKNN